MNTKIDFAKKIFTQLIRDSLKTKRSVVKRHLSSALFNIH